MSKPVVICVDDEPTVLESLKIDLKRILGDTCLIESAEDGNEALDLYEAFHKSGSYDVALIIADYLMPGIKGDEVVRRVHGRSPRTLSVMISGQADLAAVMQVLHDSQLYRDIAKPWTPEELNLTVIEAIERYLQIQERTEELQQKMQELEKLNQLKDEFLHAVTHDLRTPVTGTLLVFQRLQKQAGEAVTLSQNMVERIVESSNRQLKLLDLLLQVQLSDTQGVLLNCKPTDLATLVSAIARELDPILQEHSVTLKNLISTDLPLLNVDELQVGRVFENLINNALKHNPPGICLTLHAVVEGTMVRCSVEDNGIGIPEPECDAMFERYVQGSRSRRGLGVGLGLYLCRQIIQTHGGEIGVLSALNQGARFWFTLPIAQPL